MKNLPVKTFHQILKISILVLIGCISFEFKTVQAQAFLSSPQFSHKTHVKEFEISCEFCHYYADRSIAAGIPSLTDCLGCHQLVKGSDKTKQEEIRKLDQFLLLRQPLQWKRNNDLPDFVFFTHQRHIASGFSCEECHGDLSISEEASGAGMIRNLTMGWCVDCHVNKRQLPNDTLDTGSPNNTSKSLKSGNSDVITGSTDCQTCHK